MMTFDIFVGKNPGAMALTLILYCPHLTAKSFVNVLTAPLLALYATVSISFGSVPINPAMEEMLIIFPALCLIISLPTAWLIKKVPVTFTFITFCHASKGISMAEIGR